MPMLRFFSGAAGGVGGAGSGPIEEQSKDLPAEGGKPISRADSVPGCHL